jgi:hypothetical protein
MGSIFRPEGSYLDEKFKSQVYKRERERGREREILLPEGLYPGMKSLIDIDESHN